VGTAQLLLRLIAAQKPASVQGLVDYVLSLETKLSTARPREMSVRNMVRRVLGIIREEAENAGLGEHFKAAMEMSEACEQQPQRPTSSGRPSLLAHHTSFASGAQVSMTSLFNIISQSASPHAMSAGTSPSGTGTTTPVQLAAVSADCFKNTQQKDIRPAIIQDIKELVDELESSEMSIAEYAPQLIHKNEVIMTYGLSSTVHRLLLRAAHKRGHDFTVVVVEGSQNIFKHTHAAVMNKIPASQDDVADITITETTTARKSLQDRGVQVIVISDVDIYNFIARVNKVILDANYVLADDSVLASSGALNVARAAKALMKPVVVVAGSHILCPVTSYYQQGLVEMGQPVAVGYERGELLDADFPNPLVDLIGPQFVTMFVTNKYEPTPRTS